MSKTRELRAQRAELIAAMRGILDSAEAEKRSLNAEESQKYDELGDKADQLRSDIERHERQAELDRELAATVAETEARKSAEKSDADPAKHRENAFRNWMRGGMGALKDAEIRALQADSDPDGGYLVAPEQFVNQLIKFVDDQVFIRRLATVIQVNGAQSLGMPSLETDPSDSDWTTELATGSEDTAMAFGKREMTPRPLAKRIKVSNKLLRSGVMNVESLVMQRLAYKFAITEEKAFLTGTGANQPLGIFTASTQGISTARDVSTGNTATDIRGDGLIEAKYTLKGAYWPRAAWVFHRDCVKRIAKLKDGDGQYLWQQSIQEGQPDRLMGFPMYVSEYVPNTFTTGLYVGALADFSNYYIADSLSMQMQRLVELYAETNQTGFIGRMELDGAPVLEEAFVRVKLA